MQVIKKLLRNKAGATAIEYALLASLLALAIVGSLQGLEGALQTTFNNTSSGLTAA